MAVMTSPAFDKVPLDLKPNGFAPADVMALDTEANGVHDVLFDEAIPQPTEDLANSKPTVNGNHVASETSPIVPTTNVSSGMEGVAQFLPDSQPETKSLLDASDPATNSVANAIEAPTSDVRDETPPETQSTEKVPETQIPAKSEDAMDISTDAPTTADSSAPPTNSMTELSIQTQQSVSTPTQTTMTQSPSNMDHTMDDAPASGKVRPREEDEDDGPDAKRTKTEDEAESQAEFKVPEAPATGTIAVIPPHTNGTGTPITPTADQSGIHKAITYEDWPKTPITNNQNKFLLERIRNTKKIKVSLAFKEPVNAELLNIPHYYDLVKKPMDLSTMEQKLKEGKYPDISEFMADLDQMVENSELFNGKEHPVTQAGYNMRAYFLKGMGKMPRLGDEEPAKQAKAKKPTVATTAKPRRESRAVPTPTSTTTATAKSPTGPGPTPAPTPTTAVTPQVAWPLGADGMPLIRRDSSAANDRPKREIHRPSKDLPYSTAKPRKKKYQQELKFCESLISELMKPKYAKFAYPFMSPVDPVALNIPSYLKIIKKPMDFGTIEKNLKQGAYQSAKDFYNDAQLVFANCYKFNPEGDEVNKMGKQLNTEFDRLWSEKTEWLIRNAPASEQSPEVYSDEEEEDDEEDEEEEDPAQAQFLAIQRQIAALNETAQQLLQQQKGKRTSPKVPAKKKSKAAAPKKKSTAPLSVPPPPKTGKPKARVKAPAPLSFAQKQEISEGISTLGDSDMRKAVQIIRNGCPHLANTNDDEMELDMDDLNDETLRELFKFIKGVRGPKGAAPADDDFEPPRQIHKQTTSRPKKNKPMGKSEQEDNLRKIQEKMQSFNGAVSGSSQSPPAHDDESSDDESSGSESEEE